MATAMNLVFWGLLVTMLDFRIGGLNLIPDWVGYALVATALRNVVSLQASFRTAWILAVVGAIVSFPEMLIDDSQFPVYEFVQSIFSFCLIWNLLGGLSQEAAARGKFVLARIAATRRRNFLVLSLIMWATAFVVRGGGASPLILLLIIAMLIVYFLILTVFLRASREFASRNIV